MTDAEPGARPGRGFETTAVVALMVVPPLLNAAFAFRYGRFLGHDPQHPDFGFVIAIADMLLLLAVLYVVVRLNGESFATITKPLEPWDFAKAIGLAVAGTIIAMVVTEMVVGKAGAQRENLEFLRVKRSVPYVIAMLINPFCEEFFTRGYLQTRLTQMRWSAGATVLLSAILQGSYHIYQGIPSCIALTAMFVVFALYYQKSRRLWPVVYAHLGLDVLAMFQLGTT